MPEGAGGSVQAYSHSPEHKITRIGEMGVKSALYTTAITITSMARGSRK